MADAKAKDDAKDSKEGKDGKDAAPAADAAPKKKFALPKIKLSKKLIIFGAAGLLVLAGGGGAAAFFLGGKKKDGAEQVEKKAEPRKIPVFVDLDTFTVNLRDTDNDRFIQVKLVAELKDAPTGEVLKTMMPSVRNEILLLLASKSSEDLSTREGKETLSKEIVVAANKPLVGTPAEKAVEAVNFTHLIIQ